MLVALIGALAGGGGEFHGVVYDLGGGPIAGARANGGAIARSDTEGHTQAYIEGVAPGHHFEPNLTPAAVAGRRPRRG